MTKIASKTYFLYYLLMLGTQQLFQQHEGKIKEL